MKRLTAFVAAGAASVMLAAPAVADTDTDFANQLHTYGIYGQRDYNAWIAKITCERLGRGVDKDVYASAVFVQRNLAPGSTTAQAWQFLGTAVQTYCPDQLGRFDAATH